MLFFRCQNDEYSSEQPKIKIKTVTIDEAKTFLETQNIGLSAKSTNSSFDNLEYGKISQEKINGSDELLTVIPLETNDNSKNERILLLKVDSQIKGLIFTLYPNEDSVEGKFSGDLFSYTLDREFISGFRAKDGIIVGQFFENNTSAKSTAKNNTIFNSRGAYAVRLDGVTVQNNYRNLVYALDVFGPSLYGNEIFDSGYSNYGGVDYYSWDAAGGGYFAPQNTANPCDKIKTLMANPNFMVKVEELKKKTNLKVESGYMQSKNGPFTALVGTASTDNADKISFKPDANTIGYMHTHLDPYDKVMADGNIETVEPIKMFSPEDVKQFLLLVLNANRYSLPIDDLYGTMVSSSSAYQLRFTGNITDVVSKANVIDWKNLNIAYKETMKNNSLEQGFLKFLNEKIGINGIELYKIDAKGNSRKTLDNKGKVIPINCI